MDGKGIKETRERLKITQTQLGQLLGVHPLTVSKWERGKLKLSPYQSAIMEAFKKAAIRDPSVGIIAFDVYVKSGIASALFLILSVAVEKL